MCDQRDLSAEGQRLAAPAERQEREARAAHITGSTRKRKCHMPAWHLQCKLSGLFIQAPELSEYA